MNDPGDTARPPQRTLLLVDDEPNILSALTRLLRRDGYRILRAGGGGEGLELLKEESVGVIVSDQRMPEMTGIEFLSEVRQRYPETVRLVLSGYTDLKSVTDAINKGEVYKFLTKPWEDDLLRTNVADAFEHYELKEENRRLTADLQRANRELEEVNHDLARRVEEQTRELMLNLRTLQVSQEALEYLPVAVIGVADDGLVAIANRRAHQLLGARDGCLIGESMEQTLPPGLIGMIGRGGDGKRRIELPDGKLADLWIHRLGARSAGAGIIAVLAGHEETLDAHHP
ncbi:response regulator [Endothiovibrio diazotrophicus]